MGTDSSQSFSRYRRTVAPSIVVSRPVRSRKKRVSKPVVNSPVHKYRSRSPSVPTSQPPLRQNLQPRTAPTGLPGQLDPPTEQAIDPDTKHRTISRHRGRGFLDAEIAVQDLVKEFRNTPRSDLTWKQRHLKHSAGKVTARSVAHPTDGFRIYHSNTLRAQKHGRANSHPPILFDVQRAAEVRANSRNGCFSTDPQDSKANRVSRKSWKSRGKRT